MSVVVAAVVALGAPATHAELGGTVTRSEPAGTLIMPFDSTSGKVSFQRVVRTGGSDTGRSIATHWVYWANDCKHLADFIVCLTPRDSIVADPTALQAEVQSGNSNKKIGPVINLTGKRGLVAVTAYETDTSGGGCRIPDVPVTKNRVLAGAWTIANLDTSTGYGGDAIGFPDTGVFPDPSILADHGIWIPTYAPDTLTDSKVIVLPVKFPGGSGVFANEVGPLNKVTCDSAFVDNLEAQTSLPSQTFRCVNFNPIAAALEVEKGDPAIIPDTFDLSTSGFLRFSNCRTSNGALLSGKRFVFAFHAEAVGPFGTVVAGKYTDLLGED